jgi:hypothetical protein
MYQVSVSANPLSAGLGKVLHCRGQHSLVTRSSPQDESARTKA